jgi:hypothetical protein
MRFKDINEYGMKPGTPTPVSAQQTGANAKASSVTAPSASPNTKAVSQSPTTTTAPSSTPSNNNEPDTQPMSAAAGELEVDTVIKDTNNNEVGVVVSKVGDNPKPDAVVVKDPRGKYQVIKPTDKVVVDAPVTESVFAKFAKLPLGEQLLLLDQIDADRLNETWLRVTESEKIKGVDGKACWKGYRYAGKEKKADGTYKDRCVPVKKAKTESLDCEHGKYYCSTDKKWKCRQKPKQKRSVRENAVPDNSKVRIIRKLLIQPLLGSDVKSQMEAFFAIPSPQMIKDFRNAIASNTAESVDLRPVLKNYIQQMHPSLQKKINISESVDLREYDDLAAEKEKIADIIKALNVADERDAKIVDQIWRILNSDHIQTVIGSVVAKPIADETAMNREAATKVLTKVIYQVESDYKTIKAFLDDLDKTGSAINVDQLKKPGVNSFSNIFKSDMAFEVFRALLPYGAGKQKKGPGEFALAMLSDRIKLSDGGGDIEIDGELVELKASSSETSSGGGRLGMNPLSQPQVLSILNQFQSDIPSIMQHMQSNASLGLGNAVQLMNKDIPVGDARRYDIAYAVYSAFMSEKAARAIANSFKQNSDPSAVLKDFAAANYEDYKQKGGFSALLGLVLNARKTVFITNAQQFADFYDGPHAGSAGVSFIPTKAGPTEMFLQLNLKKTGKI